MIEPNGSPLDAVSAAAIVVRAIDDIDLSTEEQSVDLLSDLMYAAWGSLWAQNQ